MSTHLILGDNTDPTIYSKITRPVDLVYADMIYQDTDFAWVDIYWSMLRPDGIFIVQTDYHTVADIKLYMDRLENAKFVNWLIYKQEWGGVPKRGFPQKHDDILVYSRGINFKWYPERIQIPKVTAGTALDKKGTGLKTPCSVFDDLGNFSTISRERVKTNGKNIQWQKPLSLMNRLLLPFTDIDDLVVDPFMGSGTTGVWCVKNHRDFAGIELEQSVFNIASDRIVGDSDWIFADRSG